MSEPEALSDHSFHQLPHFSFAIYVPSTKRSAEQHLSSIFIFRLMYGVVACVSKALQLMTQEVQPCGFGFTDLWHRSRRGTYLSLRYPCNSSGNGWIKASRKFLLPIGGLLVTAKLILLLYCPSAPSWFIFFFCKQHFPTRLPWHLLF